MRLYYNAHCSKSRTALALLERTGHAPQCVDYVAEPPGAAALARLLDALDGEPAALLRRGDVAYASYDNNEPVTRERVIAILRSNPALMQRPVLETDTGAVIARPPERVFELVSKPAGSE